MNVPTPVFMEVSDRFCKRFPNLLQRGFLICYKDVHVVIGADSTETYTTQRLVPLSHHCPVTGCGWFAKNSASLRSDLNADKEAAKHELERSWFYQTGGTNGRGCRVAGDASTRITFICGRRGCREG